ADAITGEILRELGNALADADRTKEAHEHFEQALAIAERTNDRALQGRALVSEAKLLHRMLDLEQAAALLERACVLHESDVLLHAEDLAALGAVRVDQGRHAEARRALEQAIATGDPANRAHATFALGLLHLDTNELERARAFFSGASQNFGDLGAAR